jgi:uncharacterized membrane protein
MSRYELLNFLHIAASIIWLGAGFLLGLLILAAERAGDHQKEAGYHQDAAWLAPRLFVPASLATFLLGLLLVIDGPWSFDQLWITIGMTGWAVSFVLGFFYFRPEGQRIGALVAERGPADAEVGWRVRRLNVVDRVQLAILFLVVADMVLKPTGDDTGVLVVGAAIVAAVIVLAALSIQRARTGSSAL